MRGFSASRENLTRLLAVSSVMVNNALVYADSLVVDDCCKRVAVGRDEPDVTERRSLESPESLPPRAIITISTTTTATAISGFLIDREGHVAIGLDASSSSARSSHVSYGC